MSEEEAPRAPTRQRVGNRAEYHIGVCGSPVHFPAIKLGGGTCPCTSGVTPRSLEMGVSKEITLVFSIESSYIHIKEG